MVTPADANRIAFKHLDDALRKSKMDPQAAFYKEGFYETLTSSPDSPLKYLVPENQDRGPQVDPTEGSAHTWIEFRLRHLPKIQATNHTGGVDGTITLEDGAIISVPRGYKRYDARGFLHIQVYVPKFAGGGGRRRIDNLTQPIGRIYEGKRLAYGGFLATADPPIAGTVVFGPATIQEVGIVDAWYSHLVSVPFTYQDQEVR